MTLPRTAPTQALNASLASDTYPPDFSKTTQELARTLLHPLKPELDVETTWLTYRDSEVEFDHGSNIHRVPLIPGLIEYFTGHLQWIDNDVVALHPPLDTPSPTPDTQQPDVKPPAIQPLGRAATVTFFTEVSEQLEQCYTQNLADYWSTATLDGETRSSRFVAEQIECLTSECAVLIALGKMTTGHYSLLSAALGPCATNATEGFADLQPHSVYSLSARDGDGPSLSLYGAFAIARRLRDAPVQPDLEELEDVLLFTPHDGLEAFASLQQLNDALVQRVTEPEYRGRLGDGVTAGQASPTNPTPVLQWQYTLMDGNFLSLLLARQVVAQQSVFAQTVQLARSQKMDAVCFEQMIANLLKPGIYFDNHWRLDEFDSDLVKSQMPDWWKTMTLTQRQAWHRQAQLFGEQVVNMRKASKEHFGQAENDSRTYVSSDGVACLEREVGAVFTDNGVQSASMSRANASRWSQDGFVSRNASAENHPVFFIFAPAVPKKNMFTGFLGDHVAIAPGTYVQLGATKRINGQLFAWFDAPEQLVDQTYDLYTGEQELWV
ncbi:hypothetical protein [Pseudomonas syringae]|nr:hypothetical protein [Pseudomonas syringae]PYD35970.1 hypothetical protein DND67_00415 [Pseudomonas syringae pv. pisi]RMV56306.1 hypothetical protein ALP08_00294 [Pseudomonas syringae pv. pisi]